MGGSGVLQRGARSPLRRRSRSMATTRAAWRTISQWMTAWYLGAIVVLCVRMAMSASNSHEALGCREESTSTIPCTMQPLSATQRNHKKAVMSQVHITNESSMLVMYASPFAATTASLSLKPRLQSVQPLPAA